MGSNATAEVDLPRDAPALRMTDASYRYASTGFALRVPGFEVPAGGRAFLRGPSGSGKTTFLHLATGLLPTDGGKVVVAGEVMPTGGMSADARRDRLRARRIGVIHQQFNLLPYLDVTGNVTLPLALSAERRAGVADPAGEAADLLDRLGVPRALHRVPASALSVGQQQRVAIARALLGAPALLVADEPTSALDVDARDAFLDVLFDGAGSAGAALLMVSHDPAVGERFDRAHDLRDIAVAEQGRAAA